MRDADAAHRDAVLTPCVRRGPPEHPVTWLFEPDTFTPAARIGADRTEYAVTDHPGVVIAVFDADGGPVWSGDVDLWGNHRSVSVVEGAWPFRWPGQYHDPETGLHYNRHRYYDPDTGTYLSVDPIGLQGGLRSYAYVADVLAYADPLGLAPAHYGSRGAGRQANMVVGLADPSRVRFTQDSAGSVLSDGRSVFDLANEMVSTGRAPRGLPPIRLFVHGGNVYSLDNRRLFAGQYAGCPWP